MIKIIDVKKVGICRECRGNDGKKGEICCVGCSLATRKEGCENYETRGAYSFKCGEISKSGKVQLCKECRKMESKNGNSPQTGEEAVAGQPGLRQTNLAVDDIPKCPVCNTEMENYVDKITNKLNPYLWETKCEHLKKLRLSKG